jgi:hypothetical protein
VGVYFFPDQRGIFRGSNANDQFFALLLGQKGVVQMIIVEQLESAVNKT